MRKQEMQHHDPTEIRLTTKKRSCLGCLGKLMAWCFFLLAFGLLAGWLSFTMFPPFGNDSVAKVLLIGLDDKPREGGPQRSDSIILLAANLRDGHTTLLSVPRDARVHIPGYRGSRKINAAYVLGDEGKLKETLAQEDVLGAQLPYHMVFDSSTVAAVVDALGGVEVEVKKRMEYDDSWGNLHINLKPGKQILKGEQAVGYMRWRKNNNGRGSSDDFERGERQREVLDAISLKMRTSAGVMRAPAVYRAFRSHTQTNLTLRQMVALGMAARQVKSSAVPGDPDMRRRISFVECDWYAGRQLWYYATRP